MVDLINLFAKYKFEKFTSPVKVSALPTFGKMAHETGEIRRRQSSVQMNEIQNGFDLKVIII